MKAFGGLFASLRNCRAGGFGLLSLTGKVPRAFFFFRALYGLAKAPRK